MSSNSGAAGEADDEAEASLRRSPSPAPTTSRSASGRSPSRSHSKSAEPESRARDTTSRSPSPSPRGNRASRGNRIDWDPELADVISLAEAIGNTELLDALDQLNASVKTKHWKLAAAEQRAERYKSESKVHRETRRRADTFSLLAAQERIATFETQLTDTTAQLDEKTRELSEATAELHGGTVTTPVYMNYGKLLHLSIRCFSKSANVMPAYGESSASVGLRKASLAAFHARLASHAQSGDPQQTEYAGYQFVQPC